MKAVILLMAILSLLWVSPQTDKVPERVSMVQLLANPDKYDRTLVLVTGYLRLEPEGNTLYLHEEDHKHALLDNGLWVEAPPRMVAEKEKLSGRYVSIVGFFSQQRGGVASEHPGTIKRVVRYSLWSDPAYPATQKYRDLLQRNR